MGGGALKVESRDVKRLNLPIPDKMLIVELDKLGNEILKTPCYDYDTPIGVRLTKLVAAFYPAIDNVDWFAEQLLNDYLEHRISRRRQ